ncbi:MAG: type I secretion system permease/ATPase [Methyloligellaceae bacterium]
MPESSARLNGKARQTQDEQTSDTAKVKARSSAGGHQTSGKSGKVNGSAPGGAGGDGGDATPLPKWSGDQNFRDVLGTGLAVCRRGLVTVGIFSIFVNLLVLAIPIYLFQISDRVLTSRSTDTLVVLTGIVVGALAVHVILDMLRRFLLLRIATEMECQLGAPVLSAAAKVSDAGSNREFQALSDLQQVRSFITGSVLLQMFDAPIAPIFFLVVFLIHPQLGFIITGAGLALLVIGLVNQRITAVPFARANAFSMRANYQADSLSRNTQVLNAMGMIREGVLVWGKETADSLRAQVVGQDRNIVTSGLSKFVRLVTQVSVLGWGASLALDGHLTGGMIIAASIVGSRALAPVEGTIDGWRGFIQARAAYGRIQQLLKSSPLNLERLRLPRPRGHLSVEELLYIPAPSKKVILNGVSFSLDPGESLAIVGPSGAGKSTLARMIVGSLAPTAGNVRLDQMDLRNWDPRQFGESIGYLPQDVELFPASIKANIARMRDDVADESIFDAAELAGVHVMIADFAQGYETQIAMDGSPLSGGQKQRIALARAFFGEPRLVVLDEPNSNLDAPGEKALADALIRAKQKEISIVAVTQRPALLKSVDKIMMLKGGRIEAIGTRDEIVAKYVGSNTALTSNRSANGAGITGH